MAWAQLAIDVINSAISIDEMGWWYMFISSKDFFTKLEVYLLSQIVAQRFDNGDSC